MSYGGKHRGRFAQRSSGEEIKKQGPVLNYTQLQHFTLSMIMPIMPFNQKHAWWRMSWNGASSSLSFRFISVTHEYYSSSYESTLTALTLQLTVVRLLVGEILLDQKWTWHLWKVPRKSQLRAVLYNRTVSSTDRNVGSLESCFLDVQCSTPGYYSHSAQTGPFLWCWAGKWAGLRALSTPIRTSHNLASRRCLCGTHNCIHPAKNHISFMILCSSSK